MRYTIIIPCHNRSEQLQKAVASCIDQTFGDFEVIVIDDCSQPSLEDCCSAFNDPRIVFVRNEINMGAAASRNRGLDFARGDYVSFLDSDDVYFPTRLEVIEKAIDNSNVPLLFHVQERHFHLVDGRSVSERMPSRIPTNGERLDDFMLVNGNYIQTNSYVIERKLAQSYRFDTECKAWEDNKYMLECWLFSQNYKVIPDVLSRYNDERRATRLSKQRDRARHLPFLDFVKTHCSPRAAAGLQALVDAELPVIQYPIRVFKSLVQGKRAGVKIQRILVYMCRSLIGFDKTEAIIYKFRRLTA